MSAISRRSALTAGTVVLATGTAASSPILAKAAPDPIFNVIERHRTVDREWLDLCAQLDDAEGEVDERRPCTLVGWRNYSHIGGSEIDRARQEFLAQVGANAMQIEEEYHAKIAEQRARLEDESAWYERHGLASLRRAEKSKGEERRQLEAELARTRPITVAGAGALVAYAHADLADFYDTEDWAISAIALAAASLQAVRS